MLKLLLIHTLDRMQTGDMTEIRKLYIATSTKQMQTKFKYIHIYIYIPKNISLLCAKSFKIQYSATAKKYATTASADI